MDSPAGYVCRVNRLSPLFFPVQRAQISTKLIPILECIYKARIMMETSKSKIENDTTEITYDFNPAPVHQIGPCFYAGSFEQIKKRKA